MLMRMYAMLYDSFIYQFFYKSFLITIIDDNNRPLGNLTAENIDRNKKNLFSLSLIRTVCILKF